MSDPLRIEKLGPGHGVTGFDCGSEELNRFLARFARVNPQAGSAQTDVAVADQTVVGYDSLTVGEFAYDDAPGRLSKGCSAPRNSDQCIMGVEAPGEAHWDEETPPVHTRVQVQGRP